MVGKFASSAFLVQVEPSQAFYTEFGIQRTLTAEHAGSVELNIVKPLGVLGRQIASHAAPSLRFVSHIFDRQQNEGAARLHFNPAGVE